MWLPLQTYLFTVLFCAILYATNNLHVVLCPPPLALDPGNATVQNLLIMVRVVEVI